jgi:hypothetical protein
VISVGKRQIEGITQVNTSSIIEHDDDVLTYDFSDEALESAGGMSVTAQAGSSLYSSSTPAGCTC